MAAQRVVVTGGTGFLGKRIVELLCARGDYVTLVARRRNPLVETSGAAMVIADICDMAALRPAFAGADVVMHVAGRTGVWGDAREFDRVNATGTRSVIAAAREAGVPRLVHTSTPSVIGYARSVENGRIDLPYARKHESAYARSKCDAEQSVLQANGTGIASVSLRPHLIIGPGDTAMLPRVVQRAARGRLRIVGDGRNVVDLTYVDNAAWAHLDAADALVDAAAPCAGKAYFISNGEPLALWEWLNDLLRALGLPRAERQVSLTTARAAGAALEWAWQLSGRRTEPPITRFLASALGHSHWYDLAPAQRDLGYRVRVPMAEATARTAEWLASVVEVPARSTSRRQPQELPSYYITPTHDFRQYTRDYEQKYWKQDTAFDWTQDVIANLRARVDAMRDDEFEPIARLTLPLILSSVRQTLADIRSEGLPADEDALRAIRELIPRDRAAIEEAIRALEPLTQAQLRMAKLRDELAILERLAMEARERQRLGMTERDGVVRRSANARERAEQTQEVAQLRKRVAQLRSELKRIAASSSIDRALRARVNEQLGAVAPVVLADLEATHTLIRTTLRTGNFSGGQLRDLVWGRQVQALRDIANHALVVEQSAIAPLAMGIIQYKRRREIQEAMTTFVNDEAKHSAVFRRFLADKLHARERIPEAVIKNSQRYLYLARYLPSGGVYLAVIVEAIGAAYLEFFSDEAHMPDPLFRSICHTISHRDERRHMDLCAATYNELYRRGSRWEQLRNRVAMRVMMKAAYGDKTQDHPLLQACCAFGLDLDAPYEHVASCLSTQLSRIGMHVSADEVLQLMRFSSHAK